MTTILETINQDRIEVPTNSSGEIMLGGLGALDELVAKTNATYTISYGSHKRGSIQLPNGTTKDWTFLV